MCDISYCTIFSDNSSSPTANADMPGMADASLDCSLAGHYFTWFSSFLVFTLHLPGSSIENLTEAQYEYAEFINLSVDLTR